MIDYHVEFSLNTARTTALVFHTLFCFFHFSMSREEKQERRESLPVLWKLTGWIGDVPFCLVEMGYNVAHARKRLLRTARASSFSEEIFPYARLNAKTALNSDNPICVWDGTKDEWGCKNMMRVNSLEQAIQQGWMTKIPSSLFLSALDG